MQESKLEWYGLIPDSWRISRIGLLFSQRSSKVSDKDYEPLSVTKNGIVPQLKTVAKTDDGDNRKLVCVGDFVINSRSDRRGSCGVSSYAGSVSLINIVLKPKAAINPRYYEWLFKTDLFTDEFYKWGHGIVDDLWTTRWQDMKSIAVPVPSENEAEVISSFLDQHCAKIDALIAKNYQSIEEHKALKQSIITEAVTHGVNSSVEMKDTGLKWNRRIPAHWKVVPAKALFSQSNTTAQEGDCQLTASQRHGIISQQEYMLRENTKIVLADKDLDKWKHVEPNNFIISLRSFQGGLEMSNVTGCITWHYIVLVPKADVWPPYFKWLFKSSGYIKALQGTASFIRDGQDLRFSNFVQIPLFLIPIHEQKQISDYLDKKCVEIDKIIQQKVQLISELEAYKKSFIYEIVTGKRSVSLEEVYNLSFPAIIPTNKKRFAQAILMSRVIDKFGKNAVGRVKLDKTMYLLETHIGFDFETQYKRQTAGPLDESLKQCEGIICNQNKWFSRQRKGKAYQYISLETKNDYLKYYEKYFSSHTSEIERIIDIFKPLDMDTAELYATLYAAWNDFVIRRKPITDEDIVRDVLENWHESKRRFP